MRPTKTIVVLAVVTLLCTASAFADYLDLTSGGFGSFSGGAQPTVYLDARTTIGSVGSGVIDSFVRISTNDPQEEGYNTSGRPVPFDENTSPQFTKNLQLSDLLTFNGADFGLAPGQYFRFLLDINQQSADPLISLDKLRIYTAATGGINSNTFAGLTLRYDLDTSATCTPTAPATCVANASNGALLDYNLNAGSGNGFDMLFWVPTSVFGGLSGNTFLYLYSSFGDFGIDYTNNDGYEEWAREVPEPGAYGLLFLGLGGLYLTVSRRRKAKTSA